MEYTQNKDDFTPFNDLIGIMNIISEYYSGKDTVAEIINSVINYISYLIIIYIYSILFYYIYYFTIYIILDEQRRT